MAITKEFFCPGHGEFESDKPVCPHGCTVSSEREFRTPPAFHNGKTARTDEMLRSQVEAFGLSNIRSAREGETSRIPAPANNQMAQFQQAVRKKYPSPWGTMPQGGKLNVQTGAVEGSGGGALSAMAAMNAKPLEEGAIAPADLRGNKHGYQYIRDKDDIKVDVSKAA